MAQPPQGEKENSLIPPLYSSQAFSGLEETIHSGRTICFSQAADSNIRLIQKDPHSHTNK